MNAGRAVTLLALLLSATIASAGEAPRVMPDSGDRRVCFVEARTGSNIKQRVCMTEAERERRRKEDQEALSRLKGSSAGASKSNVDPKVMGR